MMILVPNVPAKLFQTSHGGRLTFGIAQAVVKRGKRDSRKQKQHQSANEAKSEANVSKVCDSSSFRMLSTQSSRGMIHVLVVHDNVAARSLTSPNWPRSGAVR